MNIFEEELNLGKTPLTIQDCSTHLGFGFFTDEKNNYTIRVILSQKGISIDTSLVLKDGIVIQGQMLQPNIYIYGGLLKKTKINFKAVGPSKINFDKSSGKFNIVLASKLFGTQVALGTRKVHIYCKNTNNPNEIPYLQNNDENKIDWENYELTLVKTINFMKIEENKKIAIENYLKPFEQNTNKNDQILNNNINNFTGNDNISPINKNNENNNSLNNMENANKIQIQNNNSNTNNFIGDQNFNNNGIGNSRNNLNSTNTKTQSNSFFNPNFMNIKKPGNPGVQMFGAIQEENSFMIGSVSNSNLNSIRKINNNLAIHLSNSKTNANNMNNLNNINLRQTNNSINNNINNNLMNSNQLNKNQINPDQKITTNNFNNGNSNLNFPIVNNSNSNVNMNNLQNNIKNINMNSLNSFNPNGNLISNSILIHQPENNFKNSNSNNVNNTNLNADQNLNRMSLNPNQINHENINMINNLNNNNNCNNLQIKTFQNQNNLSNMNTINNKGIDYNLNSNLQGNQGSNVLNNMNLNQQNQTLAINNQNPNLINMQIQHQNNLNQEMINAQYAINMQKNINFSSFPHNMNNNNFSFNNNSNCMNPSIINCGNINQFNKYIENSPFDLIFHSTTFYQNLFKNVRNVIRAYNLPFIRFDPNATISEILNAVPNQEDDMMNVHIRPILLYCYKKSFVISLDKLKKQDLNSNYCVNVKSKDEFVSFILNKINLKKKRAVNPENLNKDDISKINPKGLNSNNFYNNKNQVNSYINNLPNTNPFTFYEINKKIQFENEQNCNLNSSADIQFKINGNESLKIIKEGSYLNKQILSAGVYNNDFNQSNYYLENPGNAMFVNAHPTHLKSSVKFYPRDKNALNEFYNNSETEYMNIYNYNFSEKDNNQNDLINIQNANDNNKKFHFDKEEYQKFARALNGDENKMNFNNNQNSNSIDDEKKNLEKKYFEKIEKIFLLDSEVDNKPNPLFIELFMTQNDYDIIFQIENQEITGHKIVILNQSQSIRRAINNNKLQNRGNAAEIVEMNLPNSFKKEIFIEILRWLYCRIIKFEKNKDIFVLREMLLMANELEIFELEKILIVKHILPEMTRESCLRFLKDSHNRQVSESNKGVWKLLGDFAIIMIAKNFSYLLKNSRNQILGMEMDLLFVCIEEATYYSSDAIEIQNLIKLVIDTDYAHDIFDLINKLSKRFINARNYNIQNFDIKPILQKIDFLKPIELPLLNDAVIYSDKVCLFNNGISIYPCGCAEVSREKYEKCKSNNFSYCDSKKKFKHYDTGYNIEKIKSFNEKEELNVDNNDFQKNQKINPYSNPQNKDETKNNFELRNRNMNNLELAKNKKGEIVDQLYFFKKDKDQCPSINSINTNEINLRGKKPNFTFQFNLSQEMDESCTVISDAFNTKSNSWQLKLDIQKNNGEVSVYLIERGLPIIFQKQFLEMSKKNAVKFNSVLFQIEVKDITFEKSFVFFFSFVLKQFQIIGYENFFNLKQLEKKDQIFLNVWFKEFPFHAACLQYISDNFQNLANNLNNKNISQDVNNAMLPSNDTLIKNKDQVNLYQEYNFNKTKSLSLENNKLCKNNRLGNMIIDPNKTKCSGENRSLFDLSVWDLSYILYNDNLNVESENFVMSFVYKFTFKKTIKEIEMLMNTLRYRFIDFKILCMIARDHKVISRSEIYKKNFDYEIKFRIAKEAHFPFSIQNKK